MNFSISKSWFAFDKQFFFFCLCLVSAILTYIANELLFTDHLYYEAMSGQLTQMDIGRFLDIRKEWEWLSYTIIPVLYLVKISMIATCLYVGSFERELNFSFKKLFQIALIAEGIFLVPVFIKLIWFGLINIDFSLDELGSFYPLSLLNLFQLDLDEKWLIYPLQIANVFELVYWVSLAIGVSVVFRYSFSKSISLVAIFYGVGLVLWVVLVVFLSLLLMT